MNDRFLRACRREAVDRTPIWLMRQAGRYMPEFRALRAEYDFLTRVKTPELAAEITLQPIQAFELDAAIVFADIIPPLEGMGLQVAFEPGPIIGNPVRTPADVAALRQPDPRESVAYTLQTIRLVKQELAGRVPLIGFSGAPFTLASYAVEGTSSRDFAHLRALIYHEPQAWHALMARLSRLVASYLIAQLEAGADALQLFDSWAGILSPFDYEEFVLPHLRQVLFEVRAAQAAGLQSQAPLIYFGVDLSGMLPLLRTLDVDVLGIDWKISLDEAWSQVGPHFALQGNLDPHVLLAPWPQIEAHAGEILRRAAGRPGHIFNLGHGVLQHTPVEHVRRLVEYVHRASEV